MTKIIIRSLVGLSGLFGGLVVIGLVSHFAYMDADNAAKGWMNAFFYGVMAAGGLFGHAVAVHLLAWSRGAALGMALASIFCLTINLSNSLGAIADRADSSRTERLRKNRDIRNAEAERDRLAAEITRLGNFTVTDQPAVDAAKKAAETAAARRLAECGANNEKRGTKCTAREADEATAVAEHKAVAAAKASTDRGRELEAARATENAKLAKLGSVVTIDVQGSAITRLLRLPEDEAAFVATVQNFAMAVAVEFLIIMLLISWEVLGREKPMQAADGRASARRQEPPVVVTLEPEPAKIDPPPRPRLVAARTEPPAGAVAEIMTAALEPAKGERVELGQGFKRYAAQCRAQGREPVTPDEYAEAMGRFCEAHGITTKLIGGKLYLLNLRLAGAAPVAAAAPAALEIQPPAAEPHATRPASPGRTKTRLGAMTGSTWKRSDET